MKYSEQTLQTFRLRNFKAIGDSGVVKFTPLTVFIGNNGSGKSSLIEGLETFQAIVTDGLDEAMNRWRGFGFIWNEAKLKEELLKKRKAKTESEIYRNNSLRFDLGMSRLNASMEVGIEAAGDEVDYLRESFTQKFPAVLRAEDAKFTYPHMQVQRNVAGDIIDIQTNRVIADAARFESESIFSRYGGDLIASWQFLLLSPDQMGEPGFAKRSGSYIRLEKDGRNIADYLNEIWELDEDLFKEIVETLRYVLPYSNDMEPVLSSELGRQRYLQLTERNFKVPGWLLSTGTMRVLALLALLRHPDPPPLLCIEEIENGLDPRTINLIIQEIQRATQNGKTQVICTTHSPHLLNYVDVESIVVVEREGTDQPTFSRYSRKELGKWANAYKAGELYLKGQLQGRQKGKNI